MAGLREKKKKQREQRILNAAEKLFEKKGFTDTGIDEIAELADVGVGTVYNYFASKNALLVALVGRDTEAMLAGGEKLLASPPPDPVDGITELLASYVRGFSAHPKNLIRELLAVVMLRLPEMGEDIIEMDYKLMSQLGMLLSIYSSSGAIGDSVEVQDAVWLLYSATWSQISIFAALPDIKVEHVEEALRRQVSVVFTGLRPTGKPAKKKRK